jgi:tetratricopeptide (TPR) repeat protein
MKKTQMTNDEMKQYWSEVLRTDAILYARKWDYDNAIKMAKYMLETAEEIVEPDPSYISSSLLFLADLYCIQGQPDQAELLCQRAREIADKSRKPIHSEVATKPENQPDIQTENKPSLTVGTRVRFNKKAFLAMISEKPNQTQQTERKDVVTATSDIQDKQIEH